MSKIINELATIEVSNEVLEQLDVGGIYQSFSKNYQKLDDLKNFRSDYEKKNKLMRWWHNDKLRDAQLDSAEVQAEFSKTIGQLMMISIMQSKRLAEQQTQLNEQQGKLKSQADGIEGHAGELQKQHQVLAEQSTKLEKLVHEYFSLKGLTEDGARKLIEIANEIKATKESMLQEFSVRAHEVENQCVQLRMQMDSLSTEVSEQINLSVDQTQASIVVLQNETRDALSSMEAVLREEQLAAQQEMGEHVATQAAVQQESLVIQIAKNAEFLVSLDRLSEKIQENNFSISGTQKELAACVLQQDAYQVAQARFEKETSYRFKRLMLIIFLVAAGTVITLAVVAYISKWI